MLSANETLVNQEHETTLPETSGQTPFSAPSPSVPNVRPHLLPYLFKPGNTLAQGRPKNVFNLQLRCKELGGKMMGLLEKWAASEDFRAALPAIRMIMASGFPQFEKATAEMGAVPPGFENLSVAQRIEVLKQRRAELKQVEQAAAASAQSVPVVKSNDTGTQPARTEGSATLAQPSIVKSNTCIDAANTMPATGSQEKAVQSMLGEPNIVEPASRPSPLKKKCKVKTGGRKKVGKGTLKK